MSARRAISARWVLAIAAVVAFWGLVTAADAKAAGVTDVTMYSDTGDYIGQGAQQVFTPGNATFSVGGNASDITINVNAPSGYTLEFAAPRGQLLQPGVYDGATRAPFRSGLEPGIDISGSGRGCNADQGRFEIKDIHFDSTGAPDRLWLVYEQHCEGAVPALFGEVRLNEPPDSGDGMFSPGLVRWPVNGPGVAETVVPVQFNASAPSTVSGASVGGSDPGDFLVQEDDCANKVLAPGAACDVYVKFVPSAPGLRTATLSLTDGGGTVHTTALQGWTHGGTTRLVMNSDSGDWIGQGQRYDFTPSGHLFWAGGDRNGFAFSVDSGNWTGSFHPGQGGIFTAGATYTGAQRDAFRGSAPGIEVDSPGRGCNTITGDFQVVSATFTPDGTMQTFVVKFDQYCDGNAAGLHGEFDWRDGDRAPRAPWMGPGGPCSLASCGGASASGASSAPSATGGSTSSHPSTATTTGSAQLGRLSALAASVAATERKLGRALAQLHRNPGKLRARRAAVAAVGALARDIAALRQLIVHSSATAASQPTERRILGALSTLIQILHAEQHALATPGASGLAATLRVAHRTAARQRRALAILVAGT